MILVIISSEKKISGWIVTEQDGWIGVAFFQYVFWSNQYIFSFITFVCSQASPFEPVNGVLLIPGVNFW